MQLLECYTETDMPQLSFNQFNHPQLAFSNYPAIFGLLDTSSKSTSEEEHGTTIQLSTILSANHQLSNRLINVNSFVWLHKDQRRLMTLDWHYISAFTLTYINQKYFNWTFSMTEN